MSMPETTPRSTWIALYAPQQQLTPRACSGRASPLTGAPATPISRTQPYIPDTSDEGDAGSISSVHDSKASPSAKSSNWKASIELSVATRRRLIRKPLPQLPGSGGFDDEDSMNDGHDGSRHRSVEDELVAAERWWPHALPDPLEASGPVNGSLLFPRRERSQADGGLDDQSADHLLTILHYAALSPRFQASTSPGSDPSASGYTLDAHLVESLHEALVEALAYLSRKEVLSALQRTASIRWRAEAQLRNAAAVNASQTDAAQGSTSKWARFAWPAAALGRAYREAQRGTMPPLPSDSLSFDANTAGEGFHQFGGDPRIRKRDVAIKILSNAVWFVRNYGPAAGVETFYGRYPAPYELASSTLASAPFTDEDADHDDAVKPQRPAGPAFRRVSDSLMKIGGTRPTVLSKSIATLALSGTATPEPVSEASSPTFPIATPMTADVKVDAIKTATVATAPATPSSEDEPDVAPAIADETSAPVAATPQPSKAMEHLASLNAASGAALRAKAQALHRSKGGGGNPDAFADGISQRLAHQSSRPSLRSTTSYRTEAEAVETAALEKAERDYLAMLGKAGDEWAKMVVCRLCASFQMAGAEGDEGQDTLKARKNQQGQALAEQLRVDGTDGPLQTTSSISTRSDMTARAPKATATTDDRPIVWVPEVFQGEDVFGSAAGEVRRPWVRQDRQDHSDRVKVIGGSFYIRVKDDRERKALSSILGLMIYAGCSMILETGFLRDSDAARPKVVRVPARFASTLPQPRPTKIKVPQRRQSTLSSLQQQQQRNPGEAGRPDTASKTTKASSQSSPSHSHKASTSSSRRWTKSLWGMLHAKSAASSVDGRSLDGNSAGDADDTASADGDHARRPSLQLARTISGSNDGSGFLERRRSSKGSTGEGLPCSKTISQHQPRSSISSITQSIGATFGSMHSRDSPDANPASLSSRANAKLGRLIRVFGRALPEASAASSGGGGGSGGGDESGEDDVNIESQATPRRERRASVPDRVLTEAASPTRHATNMSFQPAHVAKFPLPDPGPMPLTSSPELAMLSFYRHNGESAAALTYIDAFLRLQSIGFLCGERSDGVTFATPSNGISSTGELHPQVGVKDGVARSSAASLSSLPNLPPPPPRRAHQLLAAEVRRPSWVAANGFRREEVAFYQRLSNSRDVPLGQVIEELCVRAGSLEAEESASSNGAIAADDKASARAPPPSGGHHTAPEQRIQFLHGDFQIKIVATMLPAKTVGGSTAGASAGEGVDAKCGNVKKGGPTSDGASDCASITSDDADISAVAAALHTNDKEAAKTAVAVAETAVQAAELGTQVLVDGKITSESSIWMWNANGASGWQGRARPMSESTYLMSFARYLEAILYHPALQRVGGMDAPGQRVGHNGAHAADAGTQKQLKEGRDEDARSVAEGVQLLRMFRSGRAVVKVHAQPIRIYQLAMDGPTMHGRPKVAVPAESSGDSRRKAREDRAKRQGAALLDVLEETRLEVQRFFASVKQQMTALEDLFVARELDETGRTIRSRNPIDMVASIFADSDADAEDGDTSIGGSSIARSVDSRTTVSGSLSEPLTLLTRLQTSLRTDEFELYDALKVVKGFESVNGIRKAFADRAKSAKNRLGAWIKKHLTKAEQAQLGRSAFDEPEYLISGRHAFPGSQYLVRENEPLSIIAFSLSSRDFKAELGTWKEPHDDGSSDYFGTSKEIDVLSWRRGIVEGSGSRISSASSFVSSSPLREKSHRSVPALQLDPDTDEVFYEPEPVQTTLKRKKRARETSTLSLRLRRVGSSVSGVSTVSDRRMSRTSKVLADDDAGSHNEADGGSKEMDEAEKALARGSGNDEGEADADADGPVDHTSVRAANVSRAPGLQPAPRSSSLMQRPAPSSTAAQHTDHTNTISSAATDSTFRALVTQVSGRPLSLASIFPKDTDDGTQAGRREGASRAADDLRSDDEACTTTSTTASYYRTFGHDQRQQQGLRLPINSKSQTLKSTRSISESVASTAASSRTLDGVSLAPSSALPTPSVATSASAAVESPHIKHNLVHGHTKISCVSWFAEEFAALREKWGVEDDFVQSLSRCQPWSTTGGKSKSAFFKTQDERYIGKQLLTVWSVDEKEAFLEFAPAYLKYMMNSFVNDCPTLLAKIAGVYSVKIKDTKTGETRLKMNVMIQENLWAGDGGQSVRFDLKGIKDRKVKLNPQQQAAATAAAGDLAATPAKAAGLASSNGLSSTLTTLAASTSRPLSSSTTTAGAARPSTPSATPAVGTSTGTNTTATGAVAEDLTATVWWDSDWIGRYKSTAFVAESQKDLFCKALHNDTHFLTASNIMDYSLLLGVIENPLAPSDSDGDGDGATMPDQGAPETKHNRPRPVFRCRIVDFLGAFTLAKQLESSSKKALKSGVEAKGNVTILPPSEYATRFVSTLEGYFTGVPTLPTLDPERERQGGNGKGAACGERKRLDPVL